MKKSLFLLLIVSFTILSSCQSKPLFKTESECLEFIKQQITVVSNCPGIERTWVRWGEGYQAEICNGTIVINITAFSADEVDYTVTYRYFKMDPWTGPGGIGYGRDHSYKVVRKMQICRDGRKPVTHKISGHVTEEAPKRGPYSQINKSYDE